MLVVMIRIFRKYKNMGEKTELVCMGLRSVCEVHLLASLRPNSTLGVAFTLISALVLKSVGKREMSSTVGGQAIALAARRKQPERPVVASDVNKDV